MAASPGTRLAGYHFCKHINDDLIDQENVTTKEQMKKTKSLHSLSMNLFDNVTKPFITYCGTHYHEEDLYMDFKQSLTDEEGYYNYTTYNPVTKQLERRRKQL